MTLSRLANSQLPPPVFGPGATSWTRPNVLLDGRAFSQTLKALLCTDQPRLDQAWFWTPEWQAMESEAEADLAAGRYEVFDTIDDFIEGLRQLIKD